MSARPEAVGLTPLQVWSLAIADVIADARDTLDDDVYRVFVDLALRRVEREFARLGMAEFDDWRRVT